MAIMNDDIRSNLEKLPPELAVALAELLTTIDAKLATKDAEIARLRKRVEELEVLIPLMDAYLSAGAYRADEYDALVVALAKCRAGAK